MKKTTMPKTNQSQNKGRHPLTQIETLDEQIDKRGVKASGRNNITIMGQSDNNPNIKETNSYKNKARLFLPPKFSNKTGGVKSVELFPEPLPLHFPRWNGSNNHRKFKIRVCLPNKLRILVVGNIIQTRS